MNSAISFKTSAWKHAARAIAAIFALVLSQAPAVAGTLTFNRAYQGGLSGQTFTTSSLLNADAGSIRFTDGSNQRAFQNTSGTLTYTVGGVPYSETGVLNSRYPNGNTLMNAVAFSGGSGDRLLVLGGSYTAPSSYSGSSNAILAKLNEYVDATAPDPSQTTLLVNGGTSASTSVGGTATIVVTVKLGSGTAVSGATVSISGSPSGGSSISPASATSNASGQASFTVQGLQAGTVTYAASASANGTTTTSSGTVSVTYLGVRTAAQSTASVPAGRAGTATPIVITVRDSGGNVMTGAGSGLAVNIGGTNVGATPTSITDNGNGTYSVAYTPTNPGTDTVAITLDGGAISGSPYSSVVSAAPTPPTITTASLPTPVFGRTYSQAIATTGGTAPVAFSVTGGALPTGLSLNASTGVISGTPTAAGAYSFTVTATDANSLTGAKIYGGTIAAAVAITTASLPTPILGQAYSQTVATTGGTAPVTFAVSSGALPAGLSLNTSTGAISGTATAPGAYSFTVTATDANNLTDAKTYSGTIAASVAITTASLPTPILGQAYSQTVATTGGTAPVTFSVTAGALPSGLSLNISNGVISGTATAAGAYSFTVTATDANNLTDAKTYSGAISAGVAITTSALATPILGQAYSQTVGATGGTAPVAFSVTAGALPSGLSLNTSTGAISGTPTAAGPYSFTITATDANNLTDAKTYSGAISAGVAITTSALATPILGQAYSQTVATTGATAPVAFSVTAGALPSGLSLNTSTGAISGTPTAAGAYSFTVTATDANNLTDARAYSGAISARVAITTGLLPTPVIGQPYTQTVAITGGAPALTFAITGGALPAGLSLDTSTGVISGTATTAGAYSFTITATDASGLADAKTFAGSIAALLSPPTAGPVSLTVSANSSANAVTPNLSGDAATSVAIGAQPAHGQAIASSLAIAYTPAPGFSGIDSFTYTATNATGSSTAATVTVTVTAPSLVLSPVAGALPEGMVGVGYTQTLSATAGASPYHYVVSGGALPAGLSLDASSGALTGTPTAAETYTFDITITDANSAEGSARYTIVVAPAPPTAADSTSATVPANTQTQAGQNVSLNLSTLVSGDVDEVRIVTQPRHGAVTLSRTVALRGGGGMFAMALAGAGSMGVPSQFVAVYTPEKDFQGVDSFEFVAVGPGGTSTPATATITVVGRAPIAKALTASTTDGKMVAVELTTGAAEGPFTAAALGAVTPADAATIKLVPGGTDSDRTFRLEVTPKVRFGGAITIGYTLTNVFGVSSPATVTINVTARPAPSADPVVQAVSDAQAEAARRFARSQVDNFMRRAESLHGVDCLSPANDVRVVATGPAAGADDRGRTGGPAPTADGATAPASRSQSASTSESRPAQGCRSGRASVWAGGAIEVSTRDASTGASRIKATTNGLSLGVDARVAEHVSVGVGVGYGEDRGHVGGDHARVSSTSKVLAAYGGITPADGVFVDAMIAHGWLDFDTRRLDLSSGLTTLGARDGHYTIAALSAGVDRQTGGLRWSPYGRLELLDGALSAYREEGAGIYDLRFDRRTLRSSLGVLGLRASYDQPTSIGVLSTSLRTEWRHEFTGGSRQGLDYADVTGAADYSLPARGWAREEFVLEPGLGLLLPSGWELGADLGLRVSSGDKATQGRVGARKQF